MRSCLWWFEMVRMVWKDVEEDTLIYWSLRLNPRPDNMFTPCIPLNSKQHNIGWGVGQYKLYFSFRRWSQLWHRERWLGQVMDLYPTLKEPKDDDGRPLEACQRFSLMLFYVIPSMWTPRENHIMYLKTDIFDVWLCNQLDGEAKWSFLDCHIFAYFLWIFHQRKTQFVLQFSPLLGLVGHVCLTPATRKILSHSCYTATLMAKCQVDEGKYYYCCCPQKSTKQLVNWCT